MIHNFFLLLLNIAQYVLPKPRNKTLMFGYLNIERASGMEWYKRILVLGLPEPRDLSINPKNTIGTVVALNGHRKYYCLFHAKHPEAAVFGVSLREGGMCLGCALLYVCMYRTFIYVDVVVYS